MLARLLTPLEQTIQLYRPHRALFLQSLLCLSFHYLEAVLGYGLWYFLIGKGIVIVSVFALATALLLALVCIRLLKLLLLTCRLCLDYLFK